MTLHELAGDFEQVRSLRRFGQRGQRLPQHDVVAESGDRLCRDGGLLGARCAHGAARVVLWWVWGG